MARELFRHTHRVTYAECTLGNHIYHARYLDLLEAARGEFCRHLGVTCLQLQEQDTIFPVIECRLRYKAPARYDDLLTIEVWPTFAKKVRLDFAYRIINHQGIRVLEAETSHVCCTTQERTRRLPEELLQRLRPFLIEPATA
jgi:acyl-CoA thioester hydrolase